MVLLVLSILFTSAIALIVEIREFLSKQPDISWNKWSISSIQWHRHAIITFIVILLTFFLGLCACASGLYQHHQYGVQFDRIMNEFKRAEERAAQEAAKSAAERSQSRRLLEDAAEAIKELKRDPSSGAVQSSAQEVLGSIGMTLDHPQYTWKDGSISLPIRVLSGSTRLTANFPTDPFINGPKDVEVTVSGVPEDIASQIRFQVKSDKQLRSDGTRSEVLGNADVGTIGEATSSDRGYYLARRFENLELLAGYPNAQVRLTLIDVGG